MPKQLTQVFRELSRAEKAAVFLIALLGTITVSLTLWSLIRIIETGPTNAAPLASLVSGFSSVLLIALTGWYVMETRRMVNEAEQTRLDEKQARAQRRENEEENLRVALHKEIGKIAYVTDLSEEYSVGYSGIDFLVPKTVYESNSGELGQLSSEEVDAIVEYYTRAEEVESMIKVQRNRDYPHDKDALTEYFQLSRLLLEQTFTKLTLGWYTPDHVQRAEGIKQRMALLAEAQQTALEELSNQGKRIESERAG